MKKKKQTSFPLLFFYLSKSSRTDLSLCKVLLLPLLCLGRSMSVMSAWSQNYVLPQKLNFPMQLIVRLPLVSVNLMVEPRQFLL